MAKIKTKEDIVDYLRDTRRYAFRVANRLDQLVREMDEELEQEKIHSEV